MVCHTYAPPQHSTGRGTPVDTFSITLNPERIRVWYYFFFWSMCVFAKVLTTFIVAPKLAAGAPPGTPIEQLGCGPFDREGYEGLTFGQGFAMNQTHLEEAFGFGNICTNWDYSPAREWIAMYFPLFEYSFAIYLVLDWAVMKISHSRGEIPKWYMNIVNVVNPLCIVLVILFRLIFVYIAYESIRGHTAGFLGMQIALLLVSVMNVLYVTLTKQDYPTIPLSSQQARKFAIVYLVLNGFISLVKIYGTVIIVLNDGTPPGYFDLIIFNGITLGWVIDRFWMIMNAILPPIIAYVRSVNEENVTLTVSSPKHVYRSETTGEAAQLLQQS